MRRSWPADLLVLAATVIFTSYAHSGEEFYYWVDENGVANFSQWAPAGEATEVSRLELPATEQPVRDPGEDIYAVAATAEQMQLLWDDFEQKREELRVRQERAAQQVVLVPQATPSYGLSGWYGYGNQRPGHRPGGRPERPPMKPEEPAASYPIRWP